jgi:fucose 4-O-acetylase-like acetyltransferase
MPRDADAVTTSGSSQNYPKIPAKPRTFGRDESLDIAKGFGIILVVLGHCLDGLIISGYFPATVLWPRLTLWTIYIFHMPLFFVVSGHLASGKHRPVGSTLARLLSTIVYPYFLWSILEGLTLIYLSRFTNSHLPISSLYKILWIPLIPYWFLYALFICHVGYLAIRKLSHRWQLIVAIAVFVAPLFFMETIGRLQLMIVQETVRGFLYFVLGVISVQQVKQLGTWAAATASVLFAVLAVALYQSQVGGITGTIAVVPVAIAGITATLAWSRVLAEQDGPFIRKLTTTLAFLGRYSMSIYVMHIFFTAGVRIALKRLTSRPTALVTIIEIGAATVAGILLPLGINWLVSKFDLDKWFGLQHMEAR